MTRQYAQYDNQIKALVKTKYENNELPIHISQAIGIPYGTVANWCRRLDMGADLTVENRGGAHNVVITDEISEFITSEIDSHAWITMNDLRSLILENLNVAVARSTLSNHVQNRLGYSYKLMRPVSEQRNSEDVKIARMEYVEWIMSVDEYEVNNHFIYIDESGFWINMFKRRGYAPHGVTSNVVVAPRGKKVNVCGAISGQGLVHLEAFTPENRRDNFNGTKYLMFLRSLDRVMQNYCDNNNVEYERIHLIMDNASIHRSTLVQEGYFDNCSFTVKYLPPWSPMLNPIEEVSFINLVLGANEKTC